MNRHMGANLSGREMQAVLDGIRRIVHALHESSRRSEREVGLSSAQLFVLLALADTPAMSISELAARTHTHQRSVSSVVSRLVDRGLIVRSRAAQDRRKVVLSLSASGGQLVKRSPNPPQDRLVHGIARLSPTHRRVLASSLQALGDAMLAHRRPAVMFFEDGGRPRRKAGAHRK